MEKKRLLLIHPPFYRLFEETFSLTRYPIALGYLASTVKRKTEWDVLSYNADFNNSSIAGNYHIGFGFRTGLGYQNYLNNLNDFSQSIWQEIKQTILEFSPSVVGISTMTPNFVSACNVARLAKEIDKNILVIAGGPHPTIIGKEALSCQDIDLLVQGEGERTLIEVLQNIENNKSLRDIKGIIYKKNGRIIENQAREYIEDLSELCFPYETTADVLKDFPLYPPQAFNNVFANRGCPYKCAFCGSRYIWSRKVRFRPIHHLVREIQQLQKMGVKFIYFCDDTFGVNKKWIMKACLALIKNCKGLKWSCETHIHLIDDDVLKMMKKAGCYKIEVGIESGNNTILKKMQKQITIENALEACNKIRKHGLELHAYFMAGFPDETEESLYDTLKAIKQVNGNVMISIFMPYPGTELFEFCKQRGLIDDNFDVARYNHQSLNHFCPNIPRNKFEKIVKEIEKIVDEKNRKYRLQRLFSTNSIWRIKNFGFEQSIKKASRILMNKK